MAKKQYTGQNVTNYTEGYNSKQYWNLSDYVDANLKDMGLPLDDRGYNSLSEYDLINYANEVRTHNDSFSHYVTDAFRAQTALKNTTKEGQIIEAMSGLFNGDFDSIKLDTKAGIPGEPNNVADRINTWAVNMWNISSSNEAGFFQVNFNDDEIYDRLWNLYGSNLERVGIKRASQNEYNKDYYGAIRADNVHQLPVLMMYLHMATHYKDVQGTNEDWNAWNKSKEFFSHYQRWDIEGLNGNKNSRKQYEKYNQSDNKPFELSGTDFDEIDEFGREMKEYYDLFINYNNPENKEYYIPMEYDINIYPILLNGDEDNPIKYPYHLLHQNAKPSELKEKLNSVYANRINTDLKTREPGSVLFIYTDENGHKYSSKFIEDENGEKHLPTDAELNILGLRVNNVLKSDSAYNNISYYKQYTPDKGLLFYTQVELPESISISESEKLDDSGNYSTRQNLKRITKIMVPNLFSEDLNKEFQNAVNGVDEHLAGRGENIRESGGKYKVDASFINENTYISKSLGNDGELHLYLTVGNKSTNLDVSGKKDGSILAGTIIDLVSKSKMYAEMCDFYRYKQNNNTLFNKYLTLLRKCKNDYFTIINGLNFN